MEVSFPANALIFGLTVTSTVSRDGLGQPSVSVAVNTNAVVRSGNALGVSVLKSFRYTAGDQLNLLAMIRPCKVAVSSKQIVVSLPASTVGYGTVRMVTWSVAMHFPMDAITV